MLVGDIRSYFMRQCAADEVIGVLAVWAFRVFDAAVANDPSRYSSIKVDTRIAFGDQKKIGMIRIATMFTTLIIGLIAGPLVSL